MKVTKYSEWKWYYDKVESVDNYRVYKYEKIYINFKGKSEINENFQS